MDWSTVDTIAELERMAGNVVAAGMLFEPEDGHDDWTLGWLEAFKTVNAVFKRINEKE